MMESQSGVLPMSFCFDGNICDSAAEVCSAIYSGRIFRMKRRRRSRKSRRKIAKNRNFTTDEYLNHLAKKEEDASSEEPYSAPRATENALKIHETYHEERSGQSPPMFADSCLSPSSEKAGRTQFR
mmetsp:Transcript_21177/g.32126  ORF Transcript_21177/g.32126 Transcript_21177/m.32126 type:complete len:126 (+) Transcript_21177:166-543(+)